MKTITILTPVTAVDGCGPARYRGPGGACHHFGYAPYPSGYSGPYCNTTIAISSTNRFPHACAAVRQILVELLRVRLRDADMIGVEWLD